MSFVINPYRFGGGAPPGGIPTPTHWWDFDSTAASALNDQGSQPINDMTLTANVTTVVDTGVAPDGGDAVIIGDSGQYFNTAADYAWDGDATKFSASVWFYQDFEAIADSRIMNWRKSTGDQLMILSRRKTQGDIQHGIWDDTDSIVVNTDDAALDVSLTTWYHVVITWAKDGDLKTYIDGSLVSGATTAAGSNDLEDTNAMPFAFGITAFSLGDVSSRLFGNIWASGLWDVELTADEVSTLYNGGSGNKYADLW